MNPQPKPVRAPKKPRRPIQRKARLQARSWGVSHGPSKTKHARRERGWGKMALLRTLGCMVLEAFWDEFTNDDVAAADSPAIPPPCRSRRIQVMHLRAEATQHRPGEDRVAAGCVEHHQDIDGRIGGRGKWYVALGRVNQRRLRDRLAALGEAYWMLLTPEARAHWDEIAAPRA